MEKGRPVKCYNCNNSDVIFEGHEWTCGYCFITQKVDSSRVLRYFNDKIEITETYTIICSTRWK